MFPIAAITDEFSPDLDTACQAMTAAGMTGAEIRMVAGKNVADLTDAEVDCVRATLDRFGLECVGVASPVLKCVLPNAPEVDARFQQDAFAAERFRLEDQEALARRCFAIARRLGAPVLRVFSFWRVVDPTGVFDRVAEALGKMAEMAASEGLIAGLENEAACNIATGAETGHLMAAIDHPALRVVWDPANALVAGERAFPDGYSRLPAGRIAHVHAKDCFVTGTTPQFGPLGECGVGWRAQITALSSDGYAGWISLETHWRGPDGDKFRGSQICAHRLRELVQE